jgi:hypothetical protein
MYDNAAFDPNNNIFLTFLGAGTPTGGYVTFNGTPPPNVWIPVTIESALLTGGSTVTTMLIDVVTLPASDTKIWLDDFFVSNGITLNHQISKGTGNEPWLSIRSIWGTDITLDTSSSFSPSVEGRYQGSTESVETFIRETIMPPISTSIYQTADFAGTEANPIIVSGGWDTTDMSQQIGETFIDGRSGLGTGIRSTSSNDVYYERIKVRRFNNGVELFTQNLKGYFDSCNNTDIGVRMVGGGTSISNITAAFGNDRGVILNLSTSASAVNMYNVDSNQSVGVNISSPLFVNVSGTMETRYNRDAGVSINSGGGVFGSIQASRTIAGPGLAITNNSAPIIINSLSASSNNTYAAEYTNPGAPIKIYNSITNLNASNVAYTVSLPNRTCNFLVENACFGEGSLFNTSITDYSGTTFKAQGINGNYRNNRTYGDGYTYKSNSSNWEVDVTSTARNSIYPVKILLAALPLNAGGTFTFTASIKKSHATDISARLIVYGGRVLGIPNDVYSVATSTSFTTYTITGMVPSIRSTVEVFLEVWSDTGSTSNYVQVESIDFSQT